MTACVSCSTETRKALRSKELNSTERTIRPNQLNRFSIANFHRRIKYALKKSGIDYAIGGIDFSFNEDRDGKYTNHFGVHMRTLSPLHLTLLR